MKEARRSMFGRIAFIWGRTICRTTRDRLSLKVPFDSGMQIGGYDSGPAEKERFLVFVFPSWVISS